MAFIVACLMSVMFCTLVHCDGVKRVSDDGGTDVLHLAGTSSKVNSISLSKHHFALHLKGRRERRVLKQHEVFIRLIINLHDHAPVPSCELLLVI